MTTIDQHIRAAIEVCMPTATVEEKYTARYELADAIQHRIHGQGRVIEPRRAAMRYALLKTYDRLNHDS